jgi:ATP-dependent Zn protease
MHDVCKINFTTITPRETNMDGCVSLKDFPEVDRPGLGIRGVMSRQVRVCYAPQIAEEEEYGFDDLSFAAAPYTARAREIVALMVQASGMAKEGSTLNIVPATDAFSVVDFLRRDVVEFLMRHTTVDKYFASDREAREMLEMEHRAARRFVQRQKAAIDALTEALVEHKTVDLEMMEKIMAEHAVEEPKEEEEIMPYYSPEDRERLVPWEGEMPKDSVPATNEWIET